MPSISTMLYPEPGYVRVEVNWADVAQATGIKVERVDCETGARTPLRPYVCYDGDYLDASCGYGLFWDTEPPLDRCIYYCTTAQDAAGNVVTTASDYLAYDLFDRTVALGGWGTSTSGHVWAPGVPADYSVSPTLGGGVLLSAAGASRRAALGALNKLNMGLRGDVKPTAVATGGPFDLGWLLRSDATTNNAYEILARFETTGLLTIRINSIVGGSAANLIDVPTGYSYNAASSITIVAEINGSTIRARAFNATMPDPEGWQVTAVHTGVSAAGTAGQAARVQAGNTNVPFTARWDNLYVYDPCATVQTVETCSDDLVVPSNGDFRLGDPVRPCNDVYLRLGEDVDPACVPTQGIFFANMSQAETFPAQTGTFLPTNSRYPIAVNRQRQAITATLTTVTRTFPDRDALRQLNDPGSPLLLRGPAQYGIDDRYMSVTDVTENRPLSDHRIPVRTVNMPHLEVARPSGPSTGVCGTRVEDLCDIYPTWDALAASGLTWLDLLRGKASNAAPVPDSVERTWNDVNATYADWNAVNAGNTDWDDLRDGA